MTVPFSTHSDAARALIASGANLGHKAGQFAGGIIWTDELSPKRHAWLVILLKRHGLPELNHGGAL